MKPEFTNEDLRLIAGLARNEIKRNDPATIVWPPEQVTARKRQKDMRRLISKIALIRRAERRSSFIPF